MVKNMDIYYAAIWISKRAMTTEEKTIKVAFKIFLA